MIVAHWPDGGETVIPDGVCVEFVDGQGVIVDEFAEPIASFPIACRFGYRSPATAPETPTMTTSAAADLDVSWGPV